MVKMIVCISVLLLLPLATLAQSTIDCPENASYNNDTCVCNPGYTAGINNTCIDIDECETGLSGCDENADCYNTDGSFDCVCREGYLGIEGFNCTYQCSTPCGEYEVCTTFNGCQCANGFANVSGTCEDIDECNNVALCAGNATCYNTIGSYECRCNPGFDGIGDLFCYEINPCFVGGPQCSIYADCFNNGGGNFTCQCREGFTGNGTFCESIDLCVEDENYPCSPYADCYNFGPDVYCYCRPGYTGNGTYCESACDPPCGDNAECDERDGLFVCECQDGFEGYPPNCIDVDECTTGEYCTSDGVIRCNNTFGGFTCDCRCGYFFSSTIGDCIELDRDEPVHVPSVSFPGCDPEINPFIRDYISGEVENFLHEYINAHEYYESQSCSD